MSNKKVFVVGFEPTENSKSSGGFKWFYKKVLADKCFNELDKNEFICYRGSCIIEGADTDEDITSLVEMFLEENDWDKSFK